jgi:hypothetical protein
VRVISGSAYRLYGDAMVLSGTDLFVSNSDIDGNGWLTEIDASTGALVRTISGQAYRFSFPCALAIKGTHLFVVDTGSGSLADIDAATGALVSVISGPAYGFSDPHALVFDGPDLFVANSADGSLSEVLL